MRNSMTQRRRFTKKFEDQLCASKKENHEGASYRRIGGSWADPCAFVNRQRSPVILDVRAPHDSTQGIFIQGSILDRAMLKEALHSRDCIVHIAAWHGIHEIRGEKNDYDFFDLNVRGTFEVYEAAVSLSINK